MTTNEALLEYLIKSQVPEGEIVRELMTRILSDKMPNAQVAAALALMRAKPLEALDLGAASEVVLAKAINIARPDYLYADVVGTGGDGQNTINISTLASITAASLGLPVAKHGNASVSSRCGAADVLSELGIDISISEKRARESLDENGWCFLFAPIYHRAFMSVKEIRAELGIKTIFNILGPLVNPMDPPIMLIGVYDEALVQPFIKALKALKKRRALVVHGAGLDEIALHGPTSGALLDDGAIEPFRISPHDLGLLAYGLSEIAGGDKEKNALLSQEILSGRADQAKTSMVAASAGTLLWLAERAKSPKEGVALAMDALHAGLPFDRLEAIRRVHGSR